VSQEESSGEKIWKADLKVSAVSCSQFNRSC
jgi:hypothetical protein